MTDKENPSRPTPEEESPRPGSPSGPVPSLESTQRFGGGKRRGQLDEDIERELQEAMGDQNFDQLLSEPAPRTKKAPGAPAGGKLKGKIISIHGQDVFVEVPGGRSQGVLPLQQFEEGP